MEKLADKVEYFLKKQKKLYELLLSILENEKKQITQMDITGMWESVDQKNKIFQELEELNRELKTLIVTRAQELGEDSKAFSLSDYIQKMPVTRKIKSKLKLFRQGLEMCQNNVFQTAAANKQYVQESLVVINDIFSLAVQTANTKQYGYTGETVTRQGTKNLINTEV